MWKHLHPPPTNEFGQVDLEIGRGIVVSGDFSAIEWPKDEYFLKIEYSLKAKDPYQTLSTTQLLSVPYSLYSGEAGNGFAKEYAPGEIRPVLNLADGSVNLGNPPDNWNKLNVNGIIRLTPNQINPWGSQLSLDSRSNPGGNSYVFVSTADGAVEGAGNFLIRKEGDWNSTILMTPNGNVGIGLGQAAPNQLYKLDVNGNINFNGNLYKNGNPYGGDFNALANKPDLSIYATKDMDNQKITNLADPTNPKDAANKAYVDALTNILVDLTQRVNVLEHNGGTITDADGNIYNTVIIGSQTWMVENLKTTKYKDGTSIPLETSNTTWAGLSTPAYCWYNNDQATNGNVYGALYNWYTVNTRNLCPTGWRVPTDEDWTTLTTYLGGESAAGGKLKEIGTTHWLSPNTGATNESGFRALPGGDRYYSTGSFNNVGTNGNWWSFTEVDANVAWYRRMNSDYSGVYRYYISKREGISVRCIKGEMPPILPTLTTSAVTSISTTSANSGGNITSDGGSPITQRGICISIWHNPSLSHYPTTDGAGTGTFTSDLSNLTPGTLYFVRAYATNEAGTAYGDELSFTTTTTVVDIDGNVYNSIMIGDQVWMNENLKTTKLNDGTALDNCENASTWESLDHPAYCWYNNDQSTYGNTYGPLYNGYTVITGKLCPTGWHVPSNEDWTELIDYLGGQSIAGGKLKEVGITHWLSPNTGATNESGFTALPGGLRDHYGVYSEIGKWGGLWSATEYNNTGNLWHVELASEISGASRVANFPNKFGMSVRCLRDY
jgi:uncharacterized protein (TIGR02145 family)